MASEEPRTPAPLDAGPWGTPRDLEAMRRAVERAGGSRFQSLVVGLVFVVLVGLGGALMWGVATRWMTGSLPLAPGGPVSMLAPAPRPATSKVAISPPPPPATVAAPTTPATKEVAP